MVKMTEREKLIDLINKGQSSYYDIYGNNITRFSDFMADLLLRNGVTIKVGEECEK